MTRVDEGVPYYLVLVSGDTAVKRSTLGLLRTDEDFSNGVKWVSYGTPTQKEDSYQLSAGKMLQNTTQWIENTMVVSKNGKALNIEFRVFDEGVGIRYTYSSEQETTVLGDNTTFALDTLGKAWIYSTMDTP